MFMREVFFSRLHDRGVEDEKGRRIGLLRDIAISLASEHPCVVGIRIGTGGYLPSSLLAGGLAGDVLRISSEAVLCELKEDEYYAAELLLDKQIIDGRRRRVCRVNDIVFASYGREEAEQRCFCAGVDVGIRGLCRRMKAEWLAMTESRLIGWRDIIMVDDGTVPSCLTLRERRFGGASVKEIAEICRSLDRGERKRFLQQLPRALVCRMLSQLSSRERSHLLTSFTSMEIEDFVRSLPEDLRRNISDELPSFYQWCRQAEGGDGT